MFKRVLPVVNWRSILYGTIGLLLLAGLVMLMGFIETKSNEQVCSEMRIIVMGDESFVEQKDIAALIIENYGEMEGRTLMSLPVHEIEKELKQVPFIYSATVAVDMDGVLTVRIKQREAVIRVINKAGLDFYIDRQGYKMPVSLKYSPRVPIVNGNIAEPYNGELDSMGSQLVKDVFRTAQFISADSLWSKQVVQLYVNDAQDIELVPRVGSQQIVLGNADSLEKKFEKLLLFYQKIVPKTGIDAYKTVNLKYAGQLVCERNEHFKPIQAVPSTEQL